MVNDMKKRKIIISIVISIVVLVGVIFLFKYINDNKTPVDEGKSVFNLISDELTFTEYDRLSYGKYYLFYDGASTSLLNGNGSLLENYTSDTLNVIKYFNTDYYSDYYYILGDTFILKRDSIEIATIKYDSLDFDLRKSAVSIELLDGKNILLTYKAKVSVPSKEDPKKNISVDVSYAYVYNFIDKKLYPKISSYGGIGKVNNNSENVYLLLKNDKSEYDIYSIADYKLVLNNNYPKLGIISDNALISKSSKYIYACKVVNDGIYSSCGLLDYNGKEKISMKNDDNTVLDYNDDFYVYKKGSFAYLYDYMNVTKLSDFDYIQLSSKYIITFKDQVMDIYDYSLNKLKSIDVGLDEIIVRDTADKSKNLEIIDEGDTLIINRYDSTNIDSGKVEDESVIKTYIYSNSYKDTIEGRRLYPVYNYNNELTMYYSPEYSGKSVLKVYLYSKELEAYRIINLSSNSGNFTIIDRCDNLSLGYILDNNYTIYNPSYESAGTVYSNINDYNNTICNDVGTYNTTNTVLYNKLKTKITFNQIKSLVKTESGNYLIIHDNKVGVFE